MNLAEEYLKIAKKDLKATKILYENKLYAQAIFYFAQSVEKANKGFALTSNKYSEKDMLSVNHDVTRIYKDNIIELKRRYDNLSRNLNQMVTIQPVLISPKAFSFFT
ncbi:MAG TPA: HEPN domain-containing protein [Methanosarcinaceae archaeon]|nr:HEPN domain-containing protein [Methanosarcinaceae archaeon]HJH30723.1 HEPN domain-containing protein [Methanosarcinaceae archaeon]